MWNSKNHHHAENKRPLLYTVKKPCRNPPNSDVDNGGAEPNDVGVGIFRPSRRLVRATVVHVGISRSFFYSVQIHKSHKNQSGTVPPVKLKGW